MKNETHLVELLSQVRKSTIIPSQAQNCECSRSPYCKSSKLLQTAPKPQASLERKVNDQDFIQTNKSLSKARWYLLSKGKLSY